MEEEEAGEGEAGRLVRFSFFCASSAASRFLIVSFETPMMVRIALVNRWNSGLSGGVFMGI